MNMLIHPQYQEDGVCVSTLMSLMFRIPLIPRMTCMTGLKPDSSEWCSEDGSTTTSNASITEWFLNWYPQTHTETVRPLECVQEAGELIFVPRGIPSRLLSACLALTAHLLHHSSLIATHTVSCTPGGVHSLSC